MLQALALRCVRWNRTRVYSTVALRYVVCCVSSELKEARSQLTLYAVTQYYATQRKYILASLCEPASK